MGRSALDEDAIRLIEEHNRDLEFDWTRILKGQEAPPGQKPFPNEPRVRPRPREFPAPAPRPRPAQPTRPALEAAVEVQAVSVVNDRNEVSVPGAYAPIEPVADATIEQYPDAPVEQIPDGPVTAAQARLGSEGLGRLRARHAEVLARISEKIADPVRRDELKSQAERLNPDTWVTDAEVTAGLEAYETVFEAVRGVVGRRRKRRRPRGDSAGAPQSAGQLTTAPETPEADFDEGDGDL